MKKITYTLNLPIDNQTCEDEVEQAIRPLFREYFDCIFTVRGTNKELYYSDFFIQYKKFFFFLLPKITNDTIQKEKYTNIFNKMIKDKEFIKFLEHIKKIILFTEFSEPKLNLNIKIFNERKPEIKEVKNSECIIFGNLLHLKDKDLYRVLILQCPPLLKCGFPQRKDILPLGICVAEDFKLELIDNNINTQEEEQKDSDKQQTLINQNVYPLFFSQIQPHKKKIQKFTNTKLFQIMLKNFYPFIQRCKSRSPKRRNIIHKFKEIQGEANSINYHHIKINLRKRNLNHNKISNAISQIKDNKNVRNLKSSKSVDGKGPMPINDEINNKDKKKNKAIIWNKKCVKNLNISKGTINVDTPRYKKHLSNLYLGYKNLSTSESIHIRPSSSQKKSRYQNFIKMKRPHISFRNPKNISINESNGFQNKGSFWNPMLTGSAVKINGKNISIKTINNSKKFPKKKYINLIKYKYSLSKPLKVKNENNKNSIDNKSRAKSRKLYDSKLILNKGITLTERSNNNS